VKHDGRHKARLVADGHLTDVPVDSVYSGVVSLRALRIVMFLAELNGLPLWATDVGNAYLEALTAEKVYIIAGPEFGENEGCIYVIYKALYGLRSRPWVTALNCIRPWVLALNHIRPWVLALNHIRPWVGFKLSGHNFHGAHL
jgi:hypothetical protein